MLLVRNDPPSATAMRIYYQAVIRLIKDLALQFIHRGYILNVEIVAMRVVHCTLVLNSDFSLKIRTERILSYCYLKSFAVYVDSVKLIYLCIDRLQLVSKLYFKVKHC